ncbi:MAG: hypothetical protein Q9168_000700 [Polycauliona sp. 1 TL-2023]
MPPLTRLIRPTISRIKPFRASWAADSKALAMSTGAAETDTQAAHAASTSGVTVSSLEQTLKDKLGAEHVDIEDMSGEPYLRELTPRLKLRGYIVGGCGQAFNAMIVSQQFEKKNTLARHRLVNSALKIEIAAIHAWTPKCFTPEEWVKKNNEAGP